MIVEEDERVQLESLNQLVSVLRVMTCTNRRQQRVAICKRGRDRSALPRSILSSSAPTRSRLILCGFWSASCSRDAVGYQLQLYPTSRC